MSPCKARFLVVLAGLFVACAASAQVASQSDDFTGDASKLSWVPLGDACLTAGNGSGSIPACAGKVAEDGGTLITDPTKQGALLLTPARNSQTGAILSNFTFPMSQGLSVTFTTYTWGSTGGRSGAKLGADGITFFLTDGTKSPPTDTGATGGAMGYTCSTTNLTPGTMKWGGIYYGYLGLGMDEFGNYLNSGDNSGDGVLNTNAPGAPAGHGGNPWYWPGSITGGSGNQYQPNRIGMRGAGNVNFKWLNQQNPNYYSSDDPNKISAVCKSGQYVATGTVAGQNLKSVQNYSVIPGAYKALAESEPIADVSATKRSQAWPITYKINISTTGLLNFSYSYNNGDFQPVLVNSDISTINGTPPSLFRFGFSAGTGGQNNVHEITCFTAAPLQSNSSASANTVTGRVTSETQIFLAGFSPESWWGSLVADPLVIQSDGTLNIGSVANWDAKCVLTGASPCAAMTDPSTGKTHDVTAQDPASRNLYTANALGAGTGVSLAWNNLSSAETTALNKNAAGTTDTLGTQRLQWLQGVRSVEQLQSPPGDLRARTYVLGDIIDSSPTFVGAPTAGVLPDGFLDNLHPSATPAENADGATHYSTFVADNASRTNVVYVGSNDGFLHGFRAGNYSAGAFNAASNDGKEVLGYMPYDVLLDKASNLADPLYKHDYLVDATPVAGDVFYAGTWHTWLVGGVGSDGSEIFALDVTDPDSFAKADVVGDWDNSTLTHLGNTVGTPIIARMHNGDWAFIFGSGLVPTSAASPQTEGVYVGLIDPTNGSVSFTFLDTGVAPTGVDGAPGGIAYVSQVDLDGDHVVDYLYAGDTQGRIWRFDVTGDKSAAWTVDSTPVFVAKDGSGRPQPITTAITILSVLTGSQNRVMLYFGTGQLTPASANAPNTFASNTQTFYGIWDSDMTAWNDMSSTKYAALAPAAFGRSQLLAQTASLTPTGGATPAPGGTAGGTGGVVNDASRRYLDNTATVCWKGDAASAACASPDQYGWYFDLPDSQSGATTSEQIIYNAAFIGGAVVVNTAVPASTSAVQCVAGKQTGWTMAFNPVTGGGFPKGYFPDAGGGFSAGQRTASGIELSGVGTPTSVQYGGKTYLATQTVSGAAVLIQTNWPSDASPARVSWRELVTP